MTKYGWLLALTALPVGTIAAPALAQVPVPPADADGDAAGAASADAATIIVTGSRISQLGIAESANAGVVTTEQLAALRARGVVS